MVLTALTVVTVTRPLCGPLSDTGDYTVLDGLPGEWVSADEPYPSWYLMLSVLVLSTCISYR